MKKSFTLIELLIVLLIVGILATLAVPQYQKFVIKSQNIEAERALRALADSAWRFRIETGRLPIATEGFDVFDIKPPGERVTAQLYKTKYFQYSYDNSQTGALADFQGGVTDPYMTRLYQTKGSTLIYHLTIRNDSATLDPSAQYHILDNQWRMEFSRIVSNGGDIPFEVKNWNN